jgi:glycolate oxidase iron-sulfur subunit
MLAMAPAAIPPVSRAEDPQTHAPRGPRTLRVGLLTGCAQRALDPSINEAAIRLLTRHGVEVAIPKGQGCCGALTHHMGGDAENFAARNVDAFAREHSATPFDFIVVTASGCGTTVKDWGHLLARTPHEAQAQAMGAIARDITEVLNELRLPELPPNGIKVAYHSACSLQHGQRVKIEPMQLLKRAGFAVVQPRDSHLCCGSAGTYNLLQPEIAGELGARKAATLEETGADLVAAGNIGCLVQIGRLSALPLVHTAQLLDWAYGGPRPATVPENLSLSRNQPVPIVTAA